MKRKIAIYMACILVLNLVFPFFEGVKVYAAAPSNFKVVSGKGSDSKNLATGINNSIPRYVEGAGTTDQVFVEWSLNPETAFAKYELSYFIDDNREVIFTVDHQSTNMLQVSYMEKDHLAPSGDDGVLQKRYEVYDAYVEPKRYVLHTNNYELRGSNIDEGYYIGKIKNPDGSGDGEKYPTFGINNIRNGFSIRYDNKNIHFLWNVAMGKFQFVTDIPIKGRVYDMKLSTDGVPETKGVIMGINANSFDMVPISNGHYPDPNNNKKVFNSYSYYSGMVSSSSVDITVNFNPLEMTTPSEKENNSPAHQNQENGMIISFDLPRALDENTKKYTAIPGSLDMNAIIELVHRNDSSEYYKITIEDVYNKTIANNNVLIDQSTSKDKKVEKLFYEKLDNNGKIQLWLTGFESGLMFADTNVILSHENNDYARSVTELGFGNAYTFLQYNVDVNGSEYYIWFKPYKGYTGKYILYMNDVKVDTMECLNDTEIMSFPIMLKTDSSNETATFYHFEIELEGKSEPPVYSQKIKYKADPDDVSINVPNKFEKLSHILKPVEPTNYDKGILNLELKWDIVANADIGNLIKKYGDFDGKLDIVYRLNSSLSTDKNNASSENYADVTISIRRKDSGTGFLYDTKIEYKDARKTAANLTAEKKDQEFTYDEQSALVTVDLTLDAAIKQSTAPEPYIYFIYPNVYFLNLEIVKIGNNVVNSSSVSKFVSMTLDKINEMELPPPQNVSIGNIKTTNVAFGDPKDQVSAELSFTLSGSKMKQYINDTFAYVSGMPIAISYDVYISTDEEFLKGDFYNIKGTNDNTEANSTRTLRANEAVVVLYDPTKPDDKTIKLSPFYDGDLYLPVANTDEKTPLDALRSNDFDVVMIKEIKELSTQQLNGLVEGGNLSKTFTIDGLDKNQKYYVLVDFRFEIEIEEQTIKRDSPLSAIVAFTTEADKVSANESEKKPQAPKLFVDKEGGPIIDRATVWWVPIAPTASTGAKEEIEYEIVRIKGSRVEEEVLDTDGEFSKFWDKLPKNAEKEGYLTKGSSTVWAYDAGKGEFDDTLTKNEDYVYTNAPDVRFTSMGLLPNQIYFYYVRTVRKVEAPSLIVGKTEESTHYSSWSQIAVTTTPIEEPKNLIVDRSNRDLYNAKTEAILKFDVPTSDPSAIGRDFAVEYIMKEGDGDWSDPIPVPAASITTSSSTLAGHTSASFKVTGLKPNTGYSFMVRLKDKNGDTSMYSNSASTRTDNDQEDYDSQKEQDDWLDFLKNELSNIIKQYYWLSDDTTSSYTAIYRPSMFDTLLNQSIDGQLKLAGSDKNASSLTYYIPASGIISANSAGKGFVINSDNLQIILPKNSFDPSSNTAIQDMLKQISNGALSDYMIKINVSLSAISSVDGNEPASKQARVSFELVGLTISNADFDKEIVNLITNKLDTDSTLSSIKTELANMIKNKTSDEQLVKYVQNALTKVSTQLVTDINTQLTKYISKRTSLLTLNAPMIISCKSDDSNAVIKGYASSGNSWVEQEVTLMGDRMAMSVSVPGLYVFAKSVLNLIGLEGIPGANSIKGVIIKYGLDDFLGKGTSFDVNSPATPNMVAGIVSRICGAPKGTDPLTYLNNNGITVSSRNQYSSISNQESIYLMMYLYENKTRTKISTMTIRNFSATSNISGINEKYKKSIQAAFELGVCTDKNMKPAENATTKDVLKMLGVLNSKLKF